MYSTSNKTIMPALLEKSHFPLVLYCGRTDENITVQNYNAIKELLNKDLRRKKMKKEIHNLYTDCFGLKVNENVNNKVLKKHTKKNMSARELENDLNKLAQYCFGNSRIVMFHELRMFPYILHKCNNEQNDYAGLIRNYTSADFYFISFIKNYIEVSKHHRFSFINVDYLLNNSYKIEFEDIPIYDMPADIVLN